MKKQFCEYCGNKLQDGETICLNCGAKITNARYDIKEKIQGFKESVMALSKKKKILVGLLCVVCIVCIGAFGGGDEGMELSIFVQSLNPQN